ncbi:MAG: sigma-70 family RNA polymerase sigma factor [bacterium]|nr:sigma-70 family RNA polymerase sigma factor [bacterium]
MNQGTFEEIYEAHFEAIFRYVLHRVANVAEAEDLTSQTFFKALRAIDRFRWNDGGVSAWLYRIATNEVTSHFRRSGGGKASSVYPHPEVRRELESAETAFARHELFLHVNRAMRTLHPEEQALVVLRYFEQKPFGEIAEILGKRPGALTMRTQRALGKLREELKRRGIDHEGYREVFDRPAEAGC